MQSNWPVQVPMTLADDNTMRSWTNFQKLNRGRLRICTKKQLQKNFVTVENAS